MDSEDDIMSDETGLDVRNFEEEPRIMDLYQATYQINNIISKS